MTKSEPIKQAEKCEDTHKKNLTKEEVYNEMENIVNRLIEDNKVFKEYRPYFIDKKKRMEILNAAYEMYLENDTINNTEDEVHLRIEEVTVMTFLRLVYDRQTIDTVLTNAFKELKLRYSIKAPIQEEKFKQLLIGYVVKWREENIIDTFNEEDILWFAAHFLVEVLDEVYNARLDFNEKGKLDMPVNETEQKIIALFEDHLTRYNTGCYEIRFTKFDMDIIRDVNDILATLPKDNQSIEEAYALFVHRLLLKAYPQLATETAFEDIVAKEIDVLIDFTEKRNEQVARFIDEAKKEKIYQQAYELYQTKGQIHGFIYPIQKITVLIHEAFEQVVYDRTYISYLLHDHYNGIQELYLLDNTIHGTLLEELLIDYVEEELKEYYYLDVGDKEILQCIEEFLFTLIENKYEQAVHYTQTKVAIDGLTDLEQRILKRFEDHINKGKSITKNYQIIEFSKWALIDIRFLVENNNNPSDEDIDKAFRRFIKLLLVDQYPQLEVTPSEDKVIPMRFVKVTKTNQIEQVENKSSSLPEEHFVLSDDLLLIKKETVFTLGEIVDSTSAYREKGYPYVVGYIGNELYLSQQEMNVDIETLYELKKSDIKVVHC